MSQDRQPVRVETEVLGEGRSDMTRRRFLKGLGAAAGILAVGVIPAFATELASNKGTTTTPEAVAAGVEAPGTASLDRIIEEDGSINYPGHPVSYAPPAGDQ
jgi:hypothetical protein